MPLQGFPTHRAEVCLVTGPFYSFTVYFQRISHLLQEIPDFPISEFTYKVASYCLFRCNRVSPLESGRGGFRKVAK